MDHVIIAILSLGDGTYLEVPVEQASERGIAVTLECPKGRVDLAGAPPM